MKKGKQEKKLRKEAQLWLHAVKMSVGIALKQKNNLHLGAWICEAERQIAGGRALAREPNRPGVAYGVVGVITPAQGAVERNSPPGWVPVSLCGGNSAAAGGLAQHIIEFALLDKAEACNGILGDAIRHK